jgi:uncharacterized membrane protein YgdD (TMEM256/DUF423 family)
MNRWILVASICGASGVILGALGAHALETRVAPDQLASWQTAVQYHLVHSAVLAALAILAAHGGRRIGLPAWLFSLGIALFSGSIYLLVLTGHPWLGPLTPLGGLCLIAGWISLATLGRAG